MSQQVSLKEVERTVFRANYNDGLWDIFLSCFLLIFVGAPYLSAAIGDFWSSAVFLPFWGLVFLALWLVRKNIVLPRIGSVKFGPARKARLKNFTIVMLAVNALLFVLGVMAAVNFGRVPGQVFPIFFGLALLALFSAAGVFLNFNRLFVYGLLVGVSPLVGEWLWRRGMVSHHGLPLTFGVSAGIMFLVGLFLLIRVLRNHPAGLAGED